MNLKVYKELNDRIASSVIPSERVLSIFDDEKFRKFLFSEGAIPVFNFYFELRQLISKFGPISQFKKR